MAKKIEEEGAQNPQSEKLKALQAAIANPKDMFITTRISGFSVMRKAKLQLLLTQESSTNVIKL